MHIRMFAVWLLLAGIFLPHCSNAQWQWAASGAPGDKATGRCVSADAAGNVYVGGTFTSTAITFGSHTLVNDSSGGSDIYIVKYDSLGNVLWARREGGRGDDFLTSLAADRSGNVAITGNFVSPVIAFDTSRITTNSCPRHFVARYDTHGQLRWARSFDSASNTIGCPESYGSCVTTDTDGSVFLAMYFVGTMIFGHDTMQTSLYDRYESLIIKYDTSGRLVWLRQVYSEPYTFVVVNSIAVDPLGSVFGTGLSNGSQLHADPLSLTGGAYAWKHFLLRLDAAGAGKNMSKIYTDDCCSYVLYSVGCGPVNQVYLGGYYGNAVYSVLNFGSGTLRSNNPGTPDVFLARFDTACHMIWAKTGGGAGEDVTSSVIVTQTGKVYVAGYFKGATADFGGRTLTNSATENLFFAAYDSTGNVLYAKSADDVGNHTCSSIYSKGDGALYFTGSYTDSIHFGAYVLSNTHHGTESYYLARYHETGIEAAPRVAVPAAASVFPNPFKAPGVLTIKLPQSGESHIAFYDALGRLYFSTDMISSANAQSVNIPEMPVGIYFLHVHCADATYISVFVVE